MYAIFEKQQFREVVHQIYPEYKESSINWLLMKLKDENEIVAVGKGKYRKCSGVDKEKAQYVYQHSQEYQAVEKRIQEEFPLVTFQMWEFIQFNEFVNHQISKNIIVVEIENMLENAVFESLRDKYSNVLFCPDIDEFYRYRGIDDTIVVLKLLSEAPRPTNGHSAPLEKLLVDLFTSKFTGKLISRSEYRAIYEDCFSKYQIDETKLFRYARRRSVSEQLQEFIEQNTNVLLAKIQKNG